MQCGGVCLVKSSKHQRQKLGGDLGKEVKLLESRQLLLWAVQSALPKPAMIMSMGAKA